MIQDALFTEREIGTLPHGATNMQHAWFSALRRGGRFFGQWSPALKKLLSLIAVSFHVFSP